VKPKLAANEWRFDKIKDDAELRTVLRWELEREAGKGGKPWFTLPDATRQRLRDYEESELGPVKVMELNRVSEDEDALRDTVPLALHAFEIDWSRGKDAIAAWFVNWVKSKPHYKASRAWPTWTSKGGRPIDFRASLADLAIYRASKTGYSYRAGEQLLRCLAKWSSSDRFTEIGWSKAKARSAEQIEKVRACSFSLNKDILGVTNNSPG
jgi:hypothetical protein